MSSFTRLRLIQFRAGYNLVAHAAVEHGLFAKHGLDVEVEYTNGVSLSIRGSARWKISYRSYRRRRCNCDVEDHGNSDLFLFMGLHSGLLSLVSAPEIRDIEQLRGHRRRP
jgi:hypothetical protein